MTYPEPFNGVMAGSQENPIQARPSLFEFLRRTQAELGQVEILPNGRCKTSAQGEAQDFEACCRELLANQEALDHR